MKKNIYSCGIITPSDVIESSIISFVRPACFHGAYSTSSTKSTFFRRSVGRSFFTTSKLFFQLIFILLAFFGYGQTVQTVTLTNGTTWTVPCGVTTITVEAWGAGGGGGYRSLAGAEGGYGNAGGGGGAYEIKTFTASPGTNILYKIGKGGSGGPKVITSGINSKDGTDTTLTYGSTVVLTAKGGEGANDNAVKNDSVTYGFGGKSTSTGKSGGKGGNGGKSNNLDYGGGGGGAGYPGGVGNAGVIRYGGSSSQFNTYGGAGGDGGENSSSPAPKGTGKSGSGFGGGGGGALKFLDGSPLGGDGANGGIIISYTLPKIETTSSSTVYCESSAVNIEHTTVGVTTISAVGLPTGLTATYANNVIKISGTLAAGQKGSFPYAIVPNGCESFKFTGILTVNPTPTITGVSTSAVCAGSGATIKLTGLIPNSTSTVSYTISGRAQAPVTGVVADASGAASFLSAVLNISDDYKNLVITGITVTSATPNCGQVFNQSVQIRVSVPPVTPTANPGSGATCEQITTKWSTSANASGYYLDVSTVNSFASYVTGFSNLDVGNVTSKNIIGLSANTTYYYRVRAYNSCGTSASSVVTAYATSSVAIPSTANAYSPTCSGFTAQWGYASN
uniref:glycine-rich domain-containing protein n=1 Tax=Kaistella palustris TaxID=493376 RepID=UPI00373FD888